MKLKSKLSLTFAFIVLLTITLISLLTNIFIKNEFGKYVINQQEQKTQKIITIISTQYNSLTNRWSLDTVHIIGMYALYEGYIVKVTDNEGTVLWDAQECDMESCVQVMSSISSLMSAKYPSVNGEFMTKDFPLSINGTAIGTISISCYGPYFLNENDFYFLETLNMILGIIGISSLIMAVIIGLIMSRRISEPISEAAAAARQMAEGDYAARMNIKDTTKEIVDLANSINLLANSLNCQENLRKQLSADVAHELRTPITSVQTHLEAMIEGLWEITPERLSSCHEEVRRIGILVTDLEGLAKVENDYVMLNKKPTNLSHIICKAVGFFEIDSAAKALTVTVDGTAPEVLADENRLYQVITNLLSNSIKYTPQGGYISITLSQEEDFAVFRVSDSGIGIPDTDLPFVFERFYRADKSRNRKTGGCGIGLAVVKAIVKAHNGKVEAESCLGKGSCFKVMLPLKAYP